MINPVLLGEGSFSRVYRVEDENTGELLACKVSTHKPMAEKEKFYLEQIRHPLFPAYRGSFVTEDAGSFVIAGAWNFAAEGAYCILMEYICGCNLKEFVARRGVLKEKQAIRIVRELAEGLLYLHEQPQPMLFRDLKPENVMIQADGRVRLVDVGCICLPEEVGESVNRAGTPGYAAPEQLQGAAGSGRESDVYALGKLLQFMLTGTVSGDKTPSHRMSRKMRRLLKMTTGAEQRSRIQDMRILLQVISGRKRTVADFYYVKNIYKRDKE